MPARKVVPISNPLTDPIDSVMQDPLVANLLGNSGMATTPVTQTVLQRQQQEAARRRLDSQVNSENNGKNGKWAFVKNGPLKETITFKDGKTFSFPSNTFITEDEELAKNLQEVGSTYNIVLK